MIPNDSSLRVIGSSRVIVTLGCQNLDGKVMGRGVKDHPTSPDHPQGMAWGVRPRVRAVGRAPETRNDRDRRCRPAAAALMVSQQVNVRKAAPVRARGGAVAAPFDRPLTNRGQHGA